MKSVIQLSVMVFLCLYLGMGPMGCEKGGEEPVVTDVPSDNMEVVVPVVEEVEIPPPMVEVAEVESEPAGEGLVVEMEEVSALSLPENLSMYLTRGGVFMFMSPEAKPEVEHYPEFVSEKPLYGVFNTIESVTSYYFALDEAGGTGKGYDRLYCDLNRDLDLTNDTPAKKQADGTFETLIMELEAEEGEMQAVQVGANLLGGNASMGYISFVPMEVRLGELELDGKQYKLILTKGPRISSRYDGANAQLMVVPAEAWDNYGIRSSPASLKDLHSIGKGFFTCSTTAKGEQLTLKPLVAEMGIFEVAAGGRNIDVISVNGSLRNQKMTIPIGEGNIPGDQDGGKFELPVGDYAPQVLSLTYGEYSMMLLNDYQSTLMRDENGVTSSGNNGYRIAIREDKPFVLDFSNDPVIRFSQLKEGQRVKAGSDLLVDALLVDPVVGFKFRLISKSQGGTINPTVTVTRANGEKLVEGVMPYG